VGMEKRLLGLICILYLMSSTVWAGESLRVTPQFLQSHLQDAVVLDARSPALFEQGHIQGALNFPVSWTYDHQKENGKIISPKRFQIIARQLGLKIDTPIVVYDNGQLVDAARLFWSLEVYGFEHVKVLDHGFDLWQAKAYPISLTAPKPQTSDYIPHINYHRLATKLTTQLATKLSNEWVIDARTEAAYKGEISSAKRFGHIPTAINIPASHNLQVDGHFESLQPIETLKKVYAQIPKNQKVIIYCAIGRISSANYLALRELGYHVANYDASWKEWGNDFNLPIEK